jgi:hypothetical protein
MLSKRVEYELCRIGLRTIIKFPFVIFGMLSLASLFLLIFLVKSLSQEDSHVCINSEWSTLKDELELKVSELQIKLEAMTTDNTRISQELSASKLSNHQQIISFETRTFELQEKIRILQAENSKLHSLLNDNRRNMKQLQQDYSHQVCNSRLDSIYYS